MESHDHEQLVPLDGSRRSFLGVLLGLASTFVGVLLAIPVLRYIFYPVTASAEDSNWVEVGSLASVSDVQTPLRRTLDLKQRDGWLETASQPLSTSSRRVASSKRCPLFVLISAVLSPGIQAEMNLCAHVMAALILRTARISRGRHAARSIRWKPK